MEEIWKDIEEYEDYYQISNLGNVKSKDRFIIQKHSDKLNVKHIYKGKILKPKLTRCGYCQVGLRKNGKRKWLNVHRLVAMAFISNINNYPVINHIDGNKQNNCVDNLEWCTQSYNLKEAFRLGLLINGRTTKILQYDKNGNFIKEYNSITDASKKYNCSISSIINNIRGKSKTCKGYIWKYKN